MMRFGSPTKPSSRSRFPALARLLRRGSCSVEQQGRHNQLVQLKNGLSAAHQVVCAHGGHPTEGSDRYYGQQQAGGARALAIRARVDGRVRSARPTCRRQSVVAAVAVRAPREACDGSLEPPRAGRGGRANGEFKPVPTGQLRFIRARRGPELSARQRLSEMKRGRYRPKEVQTL
jgi:hypothetical protein